MTPSFATAAGLLGSWFTDLERGEPPARFELPPPFGFLDLRPGRLVLLGGMPGSGKTAALLQIVVDLLRRHEAARVMVANVEMTPLLLVERIVSRLSGVPLSAIMNRELSPDQLQRVRLAVTALEPVAGRLAFLSAPYSLEHLAAAATEFGADVLVADYLQRFTVGDGSKDRREQLETAATALRRMCDLGACVLCASAVARQKGKGGSTYAGLNLASFRGSSELEFGCDSAYLLVRGAEPLVEFQCVKNRHGAEEDAVVAFNPTVQNFAPAPCGLHAFDESEPAATRNDNPKGGRRASPDVQ